MMIKTKIRGYDYVFETKPGLFSKDHVDLGSLLLINNVEIKSNDTVIDLGCGYGAIGLSLANLTPKGKVYMVDTDIRAVETTRQNAIINHLKNVDVVISDGYQYLPKGLKCNLIVSNPPSHMPKETVIEFIEGAKEKLTKEGKIYLVTEKRILPMIKRELEKVFGVSQTVASQQQYILTMAQNNG